MKTDTLDVTSNEPALLSIKSAAKHLGGLSTWTVREWTLTGQLPVVKLPAPGRDGRILRRVFVRREDLDDFITRNTEVASA